VATVLGTFVIMLILDIDLQRMSLGALVIALGMMVDNAIVVADGMVVRLQRGMDKTQAAVEAATQPSIPLLAATVIAVMAFYPIYASPEGTGEYCKSLFEVVGISLLFSWFISITLTPIQCMVMLKAPAVDNQSDPYAGAMYQRFRHVLGSAIRLCWLTLGGMVALLVVALVGFGSVERMFFPASSMPKYMIDFWLPQGARIDNVSEDLRTIEQHLLEDERVLAVSSFIGGGPPRFYLPVEPESGNPSYGQLIVDVRNRDDIVDMFPQQYAWFGENFPAALVALRRFSVGPGKTWEFEMRLSGPAVADPDVLREYADQMVAIIEDSPTTEYARTDWRNRVQKLVPEFNQEQGRWADVTRDDLARTTKRAFDGRQVGLYRDGDVLIPILMRHVDEERKNVGGIGVLQIKPALSTDSIPLAQVVDDVVTDWEDPVINRRDRRRTIKIQSNPKLGYTLDTVRDDVADQLFAIDLPPGYRLEWGGLTESEIDSQKALLPGLVPMSVLIVLILIALFNNYRTPLVILLAIPLAVIGITAGLLAFGVPFGFMALLGGMSLVGMMIKNAIVLLDEVNINLRAGRSQYDAIIEAAVSRLRPVALAAATTVLGVIPLLQDVFWISMAVTIMAGLAFGTVLTMVVVPVLYATLYGIHEDDTAAESEDGVVAQAN